MTLAEAIEEVKIHHHNLDYTKDEINDGLDDIVLEAIATILNAAVKGELAQVEKQDPYWKTY